MAGGGGTRFWPLSRQKSPKQLLNLSGKDALINETIQRIKPLIPNQQVMIVTNEIQYDILEKIVPKDIKCENILIEPQGRNTAPCIGYAALVLKKREQDAIMCVLPSDHHIKDREVFEKTLGYACEIAEETDHLVTIGIQPTFPSTGYGYIKYGREKYKNAYNVDRFVEKPTKQKAKEYIDSGQYLWNSGMFVWKVSAILNNFERFLPKLYEKLMELEPFIDTEKEKEIMKIVYPQMQSISIDYGIMERSNEVLVIPGAFGWNDVGSWDNLKVFYEENNNGNIVVGDHVVLETTDSIVYGNDHLITMIGVSNLIIVHTEDTTLVCPRERAQDVKKIVEILKAMNRDDVL
jgi:mannose-1-phosphate guanylyltransferase